ncbi:hypothetical protein HDZ31DRAFT_39626 [Schizophyllum fasciatum]
MFFFGARETFGDKGQVSVPHRDFTFTASPQLRADVSHCNAMPEQRNATADVWTLAKVPPQSLATLSPREIKPNGDSLPAEILTEIFTMCLTDLPKDHDSLNTKSCPWNLSQVCHRWRVIVVRHAPHLWAHLRVRLYCAPFDSPFIVCQRQRLLEALARSGDRPLDVELNAVSCRTRVYASALQVLRDYAHRWRRVTLVLPRWLGTWDIVHGHFPLLEHFCLTGPVGGSGTGCIDLTNAPKLQSLHIKSLLSGLFLRMPWHQLKDLDDGAAYATYNPLLGMLERCHSLEKYKFSPRWSELDGDGPAKGVTLSKLRRLDLHLEINDDFPWGLMRTLTTPSLEELSFHGFGREQANTFIPFTASLLQRSACPLTKLTLHMRSLVKISTNVRPLLASMPQLVSLSIAGLFDRSFFDLLAEKDEEDPLKYRYLHQLTDITLHAGAKSDRAGMEQLLRARFLDSKPAHTPSTVGGRMEVWQVETVDEDFYGCYYLIKNYHDTLILSCVRAGTP